MKVCNDCDSDYFILNQSCWSFCEYNPHVGLVLIGVISYVVILYANFTDCVAAVERLSSLHYNVDFIFMSKGNTDSIVEL